MKILQHLSLLCLLSTSAFAQQGGTLDIAFNGTGHVQTFIGSTDDHITCLTIQPGNKILAGGYSSTGTKYNFALTRYNPDGSLDNSFGTGGMVTTAVDTFDDQAAAITLQADGKIILAGQTRDSVLSMALVRYNSDGTVDSSFGVNGRVVTHVAIQSVFSAVAVQSDGEILAAGHTATQYIGLDLDHDFTVIRYKTNGSVDSSFGSNGIAFTNFIITPSSYDILTCLVLQPDNKIVTGAMVAPTV